MRSHLAMKVGDVSRIARKASRFRPGDPKVGCLLTDLAEAKSQVARQKKVMRDHESECATCGGSA